MREQKKKEVEKPGFVKKAFNFAKATSEYVRNGMQNVNAEMYKARLDICKTCPIFDEKKGTCTKCGCYIEVKAKWATSTCPDDPPRWPAVKI